MVLMEVLLPPNAKGALNIANEHILDYIWTPLRCGGIARTPHRPAASKLFWIMELASVAKERNQLWRQAEHHPYESIPAAALTHRAEFVNKQLQAVIMDSKK